MIGFDQPLNAASAGSLSNFLLQSITATGRVTGTVPLNSAVYNPSTSTITLSPFSRLPLSGYYRLTLISSSLSGLESALGLPLNGGANVVITIHGYA